MLEWIEKHPEIAAWVQALGAILALIIAISVPAWQQRKARKAEQQARKTEQEAKARELAGLRRALYTEVRLVAEACQQLLGLAGRTAHTDLLRLSKMPPLAVFQGNSGKIGLLTDAEIIPLLKLSFMLFDMAGLTSDLPKDAAIVRDLPKMQATVCGHAAEFLEAVPNIPDVDTQDTREFIAALKQAADQHLGKPADVS